MRVLLVILAIGALVAQAGPACAGPNYNGKWQLYIAGPHDAKVNTCDFAVDNCMDLTTHTTDAPGRYDVYVLALDVQGIAGTRYGLQCDGPFYFYGWTKCSEFEIPSAGWPGCDEGNAQTWSVEQYGPHVTLGILDVYAYGGVSKLCLSPDPRVGFAEFCDSSQPSPICIQHTHPSAFGCVGFNRLGYNNCTESPVPVSSVSWGAVKALYR